MSSGQANPSIAVTADIDYWSLKPKVRDIQWSNQGNTHLAHLYDEQTGLKGSMKVCIDCVTVHVYVGCDGKSMDHGFKNCNTNRPVFHSSHIEAHYDLEPNNRYVQQAILRTHRRKLVPSGRHGILEFRGYDPPEKRHGRHVPSCFRGSSPEYIIQGSGGLGTSIYYRRCDGSFRNLAHQVLDMGSEPVTPNHSPQADDDPDKSEGASSLLVLVSPYLGDSSTEIGPSTELPRSLKVTLSAKRKRED